MNAGLTTVVIFTWGVKQMTLSEVKRSRARVLVVDDDQHLLTALKRGLSLQEFDVSQARNAREALDAVDSGVPDVIVLDIMMPGFDGLHLCGLIRQKHRGVGILMLTALDSVPDRVAGLRAGADDYLAKPFALDELVASAQRVHVPPYHFAILHAGLGDSDQAFAWLEQAYEKHAVDLFTLKVEPMFDCLRSDPRFTNLLRRIGLE